MTRLEKLLHIARDPLWLRALVMHGVGASVENRSALGGLACRTVVDIGANRGQFSLLARRVFPKARITAFEPLPGPAEIYRHLFSGDVSATLHECAIGEAPGEAQMHVSAKDDSSSLLPIGNAQVAIFPGTGEVGTARVAVTILSRVMRADDIQAPALLKLDVQGYELSALRGCEALLPNFEHVYCECSFIEMYQGQALADDVIAWLRDRDFILRGVYNMAYVRHGQAVQADFLFTRRTRQRSQYKGE